MALVEIKLAKEWCGNAIGTVVRVDPLRAQWMQENGFELVEELKTDKVKEVEELKLTGSSPSTAELPSRGPSPRKAAS